MDFFRKLPKVEVHAHVNGSIGPSTLDRLVSEFRAKNPDQTLDEVDSVLERLSSDETELMNLDECFQTFRCIHRVSGDEKSVRQIIDDVISSFAADGVAYLELRTTPRAEPMTGMTKRSYLSAVMEGIVASSESSSIDVRLLLSIDRRKGVKDAEDTLELATQFKEKYGKLIVGLDVSGDPSVGDLLDYVAVMEKGRHRGFKTSVHLAEIPNRKEVESFLKAFLPDRIGHGTCLTEARGGSDAIEKIVIDSAIPLELCPSSNVIGQTVRGYSDHHFKEWGPSDHPIVLCTDDAGVFKTSLSKEYALIAEHFQLNQKQVLALAKRSVDVIFAEESVKTMLRSKFDDFLP